MSGTAALKGAMGSIRETLQADGADVEVVGYHDGVASLRLLLDDATCVDCVMPKDTLEEIILLTLQQELPEVAKVEVGDPRTSGEVSS